MIGPSNNEDGSWGAQTRVRVLPLDPRQRHLRGGDADAGNALSELSALLEEIATRYCTIYLTVCIQYVIHSISKSS